VSAPLFFACCIYDQVYQAAIQGVSASQDALFNIFDRIGFFFRRLEAYIELPPTAGMTEIMVNIMAEVLLFLAIMTKEIKRGRMSEWIPMAELPSTYIHLQNGSFRSLAEGRTSRMHWGGLTH
jgi:hypothetical protein